MTAAAQRAGATGPRLLPQQGCGTDSRVGLSPFPVPSSELKARPAGSPPSNLCPVLQDSPSQRPGGASGVVVEGSTHLSRQATLRHFSGADGGEEGRAPTSGRGVAEAAGAGSLSRRMESMKAVGDRGVSTTEDGLPGLASSTWGLRGLGGSSLTRTRGLLVRGLHVRAQASAGAVAGPSLLLIAGKMTQPPPLICVPPWRGQGAAGRQLSDVRDDGSGGGNSIWGVEAGAAVGRGWSLPSKGYEHVWHLGSTCPTRARAAPAHRVGAGAMDVLQGVLPAILGQGVC